MGQHLGKFLVWNKWKKKLSTIRVVTWSVMLLEKFLSLTLIFRAELSWRSLFQFILSNGDISLPVWLIINGFPYSHILSFVPHVMVARVIIQWRMLHKFHKKRLHHSRQKENQQWEFIDASNVSLSFRLLSIFALIVPSYFLPIYRIAPQ